MLGNGHELAALVPAVEADGIELGFEHAPQAHPHGDPHVLQRGGGAGVGDVLDVLAPRGGQRPVHRADDAGQRDVLGAASHPVAALGAALAADESGLAHDGEDVLEELGRDRLCAGQAVALDRTAARRGELAIARSA